MGKNLRKIKYKEVPAELLRWKCPIETLSFNTTDDLCACDEIIGQERALKALRLGLEIDSLGYNIFVTGLVGTGRNTTIKRLLEEIDKGDKIPDDKCYVNNFKNPDMPRVISLPAGKGEQFRKDMADFIGSLKRNLPAVFDSENYQLRKSSILEEHREREKLIVKDFETRVEKENFRLVQIQFGPYTKPDILPVVDDKPINIDQLEALVAEGRYSAEQFAAVKEKYAALSAELQAIFKETRKIDRSIKQQFESLDREVVEPLIEDLLADIKEKYDNEKVNLYLDEVKVSILGSLDRFKEEEAESQAAPKPQRASPEEYLEYQVNVIVDNSELKRPPVVLEYSPSYKNLFGTVERVMDKSGVWRADFTKIKAGSFLRANGGYLVINALDALIEPGVWPALKRTLRNSIIEIQSYDPFYFLTTYALKPEPIESRVKVVMIGDDFLYHTLYNLDEDFKKIFKVKAEFDTVTERTDRNIQQYACFIKKICSEEKLLPFDRAGVAAVAEYGVRLAGKQKKISTKFIYIADLVREANYFATKDNSPAVSEKHVDEALREKIERLHLIEDKIQEMIQEGTIMIDTEGAVVGQVNGLSIYDIGDYAFGKPSRITAKTSMGRAGIINIERESDLSGRTHNKGVLILGGYLRGKYAQDKPLTLSASLCFEQSYSGVDGDSASSTELYALLSSLSGLPLKQQIAVTGSVNQKGEIQPIGGVNEKIEGFFDVCKARGLTGDQGVIIPRQNSTDLMLRKDLIEAVEQGKFHIYPVATIDQGIKILTDVKAGEKLQNGLYEKGTVNFLVDKKLKELAEAMKEFEERGEKERP